MSIKTTAESWCGHRVLSIRAIYTNRPSRSIIPVYSITGWWSNKVHIFNLLWCSNFESHNTIILLPSRKCHYWLSLIHKHLYNANLDARVIRIRVAFLQRILKGSWTGAHLCVGSQEAMSLAPDGHTRTSMEIQKQSCRPVSGACENVLDMFVEVPTCATTALLSFCRPNWGQDLLVHDTGSI